MNVLDSIYSWAVAGPTLSQCFNAAPDLIHQFMVVCAVLGLGNLVASIRWFRAARKLPHSSERWAMSMLFAIFLLTALTCDFLVLVKMYWPIWRLQIYMLWGVAAHTWVFILHPRWFPAIVSHIGKAEARYIARNEQIISKLDSLVKVMGGQHDGRLESV